jgi:diketogulonate reductase-like aldo/keto reductase
MEAIQASGLAKSIGVSNYLTNHLNALLKTAKVIPACNQIEFHPYLQQTELLELHKKHGITTTAYGPLTAATKAKPGPLDDYLAALTKKYAVSEGEISLRWCIDQDIVPITTSSKEQRLSDYLRCTTFKLTPAEIKEINKLGAKKHYRGFWLDKFKTTERL